MLGDVALKQIASEAERRLRAHFPCGTCSSATGKGQMCGVGNGLYVAMLGAQRAYFKTVRADPAPDRSPLGSPPRGR